MFLRKFRIFTSSVSLFLVLTFSLSTFSFAFESSEISTLAPKLFTSLERPNSKDDWLFAHISLLIGEALKKNISKDVLCPYLRSHIEEQEGLSQLNLEGYDIDNIIEIADGTGKGRVIKAFRLPVKHGNKPVLIYRLDKIEDVEPELTIPAQDFTVYIYAERAEEMMIDEGKIQLGMIRHEIGNILLGGYVLVDTILETLPEDSAFGKRYYQKFKKAQEKFNAAKRSNSKDLLECSVEVIKISNEVLLDTEFDSILMPDGRFEFCEGGFFEAEVLRRNKTIAMMAQRFITAYESGDIFGLEKKDIFDVSKILTALCFYTDKGGSAGILEWSAKDGAYISGSELAIWVAIDNLLRNALYTVEKKYGEGRMRDHHVKASVDITDKSVEIKIADDGEGIAPENMAKIFEYYFTTKGEKGTGVGLYIVKYIVENLGGKVSVTSELGKGTTFTIRLPLANPPPSAPVRQSMTGAGDEESLKPSITPGSVNQDALVDEIAQAIILQLKPKDINRMAKINAIIKSGKKVSSGDESFKKDFEQKIHQLLDREYQKHNIMRGEDTDFDTDIIIRIRELIYIKAADFKPGLFERTIGNITNTITSATASLHKSQTAKMLPAQRGKEKPKQNPRASMTGEESEYITVDDKMDNAVLARIEERIEEITPGRYNRARRGGRGSTDKGPNKISYRYFFETYLRLLQENKGAMPARSELLLALGFKIYKSLNDIEKLLEREYKIRLNYREVTGGPKPKANPKKGTRPVLSDNDTRQIEEGLAVLREINPDLARHVKDLLGYGTDRYGLIKRVHKSIVTKKPDISIKDLVVCIGLWVVNPKKYYSNFKSRIDEKSFKDLMPCKTKVSGNWRKGLIAHHETMAQDLVVLREVMQIEEDFDLRDIETLRVFVYLSGFCPSDKLQFLGKALSDLREKYPRYYSVLFAYIGKRETSAEIETALETAGFDKVSGTRIMQIVRSAVSRVENYLMEWPKLELPPVETVKTSIEKGVARLNEISPELANMIEALLDSEGVKTNLVEKLYEPMNTDHHGAYEKNISLEDLIFCLGLWVITTEGYKTHYIDKDPVFIVADILQGNSSINIENFQLWIMWQYHRMESTTSMLRTIVSVGLAKDLKIPAIPQLDMDRPMSLDTIEGLRVFYKIIRSFMHRQIYPLPDEVVEKTYNELMKLKHRHYIAIIAKYAKVLSMKKLARLLNASGLMEERLTDAEANNLAHMALNIIDKNVRFRPWMSKIVHTDKDTSPLPASIVDTNTAYLTEHGWLDILGDFPYDRIYMLEDDSMVKFLEIFYRGIKPTLAQFRAVEYANSKGINAENGIADLAAIWQIIPQFEMKVTEEEIEDAMRRNLSILALILQGMHLALEGDFAKSDECYDKARAISDSLGIESLLGQKASLSGWLLTIGDLYSNSGIDDRMALIGHKEAARKLTPEDVDDQRFANLFLEILGLEIRNGLRGMGVVSEVMYAKKGPFERYITRELESDSQAGLGIKRHFDLNKKRTLEAAQLVNKPGTALVLGAGRFMVLPLAELLRERLPDGKMKFERIILLDIDTDSTDEKLRDMVKNGEIASDERARIIVLPFDATCALVSLTAAIDAIVEDAASRDDIEGAISSVEGLLNDISDPKKLREYMDDGYAQFRADEDVNFIVLSMALDDFYAGMVSYASYMLMAYFGSSKDRQGKSWIYRPGYDDLLSKNSTIAFSIGRSIMDRLEEIILPEGVIFVSDVSYFGNRPFADIFSQDSKLETVEKGSWIRPANDRSGPDYTIEYRALRKKKSTRASMTGDFPVRNLPGAIEWSESARQYMNSMDEALKRRSFYMVMNIIYRAMESGTRDSLLTALASVMLDSDKDLLREFLNSEAWLNLDPGVWSELEFYGIHPDIDNAPLNSTAYVFKIYHSRIKEYISFLLSNGKMKDSPVTARQVVSGMKDFYGSEYFPSPEGEPDIRIDSPGGERLTRFILMHYGILQDEQRSQIETITVDNLTWLALRLGLFSEEESRDIPRMMSLFGISFIDSGTKNQVYAVLGDRLDRMFAFKEAFLDAGEYFSEIAIHFNGLGKKEKEIRRAIFSYLVIKNSVFYNSDNQEMGTVDARYLKWAIEQFRRLYEDRVKNPDSGEPLLLEDFIASGVDGAVKDIINKFESPGIFDDVKPHTAEILMCLYRIDSAMKGLVGDSDFEALSQSSADMVASEVSFREYERGISRPSMTGESEFSYKKSEIRDIYRQFSANLRQMRDMFLSSGEHYRQGNIAEGHKALAQYWSIRYRLRDIEKDVLHKGPESSSITGWQSIFFHQVLDDLFYDLTVANLNIEESIDAEKHERVQYAISVVDRIGKELYALLVISERGELPLMAKYLNFSRKTAGSLYTGLIEAGLDMPSEEELLNGGLDGSIRPSMTGVSLADLRERLTKGYIQSFSGVRYSDMGEDSDIADEDKLMAFAYGYNYAKSVISDRADSSYTIIIGRDPRPTGEAIVRSQIKGILKASDESGVKIKIIDLGIATTPLLESAVRTFNADGGIMITASHNPIFHNGWKYMTAGRAPPHRLLQGGVLLGAKDMGRLIREVKIFVDKICKGVIDPVEIMGAIDDSEVDKIINSDENIGYIDKALAGYASELKKFIGDGDLRNIVLINDCNGGAAARITEDILRRLGISEENLIFLNSEVGKPAHLIEPINSALADAVKALKEHKAKVAVVYDFDADRGNLVILMPDGRAVEISPQDVVAFNVMAELIRYRDYDRTRYPRGLAVVGHCGTSDRTEDIAEILGAKFVNVEVGEVIVAEKMAELEKSGYLVPIGVEGYNGGTVFRGARCRDGLQTLLTAARLLGEPAIFETWLKSAGIYETLSDDDRARIAGKDFYLSEILDSLPHYYSKQFVIPDISIPPKVFKIALENNFKGLIRGHKGNYTVDGVPGFSYKDIYIEYSGETDMRSHTIEEQAGLGLDDKFITGGWRIRFVGRDGKKSKIWLRGSKTEPSAPYKALIDSSSEAEAELFEILLTKIVDLSRSGRPSMTGDDYAWPDSRSWMFRDIDQLIQLSSLAEKMPKDKIRALSIGCAGGEEPISLWIMIDAIGKKPDVSAFDIDIDMLDSARNDKRLVYLHRSEEDRIPRKWVRENLLWALDDKLFGRLYLVEPRIRDSIKFSLGDIRQFALPDETVVFDIIVHKNTGLDTEEARSFYKKVWQMLEKDGLLVLSELLDASEGSYLETIGFLSEGHNIYRKATARQSMTGVGWDAAEEKVWARALELSARLEQGDTSVLDALKELTSDKASDVAKAEALVALSKIDKRFVGALVQFARNTSNETAKALAYGELLERGIHGMEGESREALLRIAYESTSERAQVLAQARLFRFGELDLESELRKFEIGSDDSLVRTAAHAALFNSGDERRLRMLKELSGDEWPLVTRTMAKKVVYLFKQRSNMGIGERPVGDSPRGDTSAPRQSMTGQYIKIINHSAIVNSDVSVVVFDWDETVFYGRSFWPKVMAEFIAEFLGFDAVTDELIEYARAGTGKGDFEFIDELIRGYINDTKAMNNLAGWLKKNKQMNVNPEEIGGNGEIMRSVATILVNEYVKRLGEKTEQEKEKWKESLPVYEGSIDFIKWLKAQGKKVYIVTSANEAQTEDIIKLCGLWDIIDGFYGEGTNLIEGVYAKDKVIRHIKEQENVEGNNIVVIGDGENDILASSKEGCLSVGIAHSASDGEKLRLAGAAVLTSGFERWQELADLLIKSYTKLSAPRQSMTGTNMSGNVRVDVYDELVMAVKSGDSTALARELSKAAKSDLDYFILITNLSRFVAENGEMREKLLDTLADIGPDDAMVQKMVEEIYSLVAIFPGQNLLTYVTSYSDVFGFDLCSLYSTKVMPSEADFDFAFINDIMDDLLMGRDKGEFLIKSLRAAAKDNRIDRDDIEGPMRTLRIQEGKVQSVYLVMVPLKDGRLVSFTLLIARSWLKSNMVHDEYQNLLKYRNDDKVVKVFELGAIEVSGGTVYAYSSEFLEDYGEMIYISALDEMRTHFMRTAGTFFFNSNHPFKAAEMNHASFAAILQSITRLVTYFYDPEKKTMIDSFTVNAGDVNFEGSNNIRTGLTRFGDPLSMLGTKGMPKTKLIAWRKTRKDVDAAAFMRYLFSLQYLCNDYSAIITQSPFDIFITSGVFSGFYKGLTDKYGEERARGIAREWIEKYLDSPHIQRAPFTDEEVLEFLSSLEYGKDQGSQGRSSMEGDRNIKLPSYTEEIIAALERNNGIQAKAAHNLHIDPSTMSIRVNKIRKIAARIGDKKTLRRIEKALLSLPSYTEETIAALEKSGGHLGKAALELHIAQGAVSVRIQQINKIVRKLGDKAMLKRLRKALLSLPPYTEETVAALEKCSGNQTKAAGLLKINKVTVSHRIKSIKKSAAEMKDKIILTRLDRALSSFPYYTEEVMTALEASNGNITKTAESLSKKRSSLSVMISKIRDIAIERDDKTMLNRLNMALLTLPSYTGETLAALERSGYNKAEAARILGITSAGITVRIEQISRYITKKGDKSMQGRLGRLYVNPSDLRKPRQSISRQARDRTETDTRGSMTGRVSFIADIVKERFGDREIRVVDIGVSANNFGDLLTAAWGKSGVLIRVVKSESDLSDIGEGKYDIVTINYSNIDNIPALVQRAKKLLSENGFIIMSLTRLPGHSMLSGIDIPIKAFNSALDEAFSIIQTTIPFDYPVPIDEMEDCLLIASHQPIESRQSMAGDVVSYSLDDVMMAYADEYQRGGFRDGIDKCRILTGLDDSIAEEFMLLRKKYATNPDNVIAMSFSEFVQKAVRSELYMEFRFKIRNKDLYLWGLILDSPDYTPEEALRALSILRATSNESTDALHIISSPNHINAHTDYMQYYKGGEGAYPLGNYPVFAHFNGKQFERYEPKGGIVGNSSTVPRPSMTGTVVTVEVDAGRPVSKSVPRRGITSELPLAMQVREMQARCFLDTLKLVKAKKETAPIIIALGTSWIKGYEQGTDQYRALNPLLSALNNFRKEEGVKVITAPDAILANEIEKERAGKTGAKVFVLAGQDTVFKSTDFNMLRDDPDVFMAGVDSSQLGPDSYMYIMELLRLTLEMDLYEYVTPNTDKIEVKKVGRFYLFIPKAQPFKYEELRLIYSLQRFA